MKKNIKQAISIGESLINAHIKNAEGMENMVINWTTESKGLGLEIAGVHRDVAKCIVVMIELLQEKPKRRIEKKSN